MVYYHKKREKLYSIMDKNRLNTALIRLQLGDKNALDEIYELTNKAVFSVCLSIVNNNEDARDLMQSTYILVQEKINYFKAGTNGYAWILTIAKNLSINENKKLSRVSPTDFQENEFVASSEDVNNDIPVFKVAKRVLNADELTIVMLHIVSGYKHREIAQIVNRPLGSVLWSYNNSLKKLKKYIEGGKK